MAAEILERAVEVLLLPWRAARRNLLCSHRGTIGPEERESHTLVLKREGVTVLRLTTAYAVRECSRCGKEWRHTLDHG